MEGIYHSGNGEGNTDIKVERGENFKLENVKWILIHLIDRQFFLNFKSCNTDRLGSPKLIRDYAQK
jgi:hypothetical protein